MRLRISSSLTTHPRRTSYPSNASNCPTDQDPRVDGTEEGLRYPIASRPSWEHQVVERGGHGTPANDISPQNVERAIFHSPSTTMASPRCRRRSDCPSAAMLNHTAAWVASTNRTTSTDTLMSPAGR